MKCFYTYIIIDPRTGQPFYVGKGKDRRMYDHWKHRNAVCSKNIRLKQKLCEIASIGMKPVYAVSVKDVSEREALDKEVELVALYGRLDIGTGILCNLTNGGDPGGTSWSPETKRRKSQIELSKNKGHPVSQYSLDGTFIASYPSAKRASEMVTTANRSYITQCCKRNRLSAGDFLWAYSSDPAPVYTHAYNTRVEQLTKAGEPVTIHRSVTTAADSVGTSPQAISSACRGKSKTCAGYVWRYIE